MFPGERARWAQADEVIEDMDVDLPDVHALDRLESFGRKVIPAVA